jgi:cytochrome c553
MWTRGDRGSQVMHPGRTCVSCHAANGATSASSFPPLFQFAGTVFPTAHEPDECNGLPGGAKVVVRGADGRELVAPVNAAGNFFYAGSPSDLVMPFTAKVVTADGKERPMQGAQRSGDCNSCHTQDGERGAPGRIVAP